MSCLSLASAMASSTIIQKEFLVNREKNGRASIDMVRRPYQTSAVDNIRGRDVLHIECVERRVQVQFIDESNQLGSDVAFHR